MRTPSRNNLFDDVLVLWPVFHPLRRADLHLTRLQGSALSPSRFERQHRLRAFRRIAAMRRRLRPAIIQTPKPLPAARDVEVSVGLWRCDKNASDFEPATAITLEGVEIANVILRLNAEQTHFALAVWAQD